jgi:putative alpha-1,2-mannosidase
LMGSLNVLLKIGLFQMNGGTEENPQYQIGSPIFNKVSIQLNPKYYQGKNFVIEANNNSASTIYINDLKYNNLPLKNFNLSHRDITNGGKLILEMSDKPSH